MSMTQPLHRLPAVLDTKPNYLHALSSARKKQRKAALLDNAAALTPRTMDTDDAPRHDQDRLAALTTAHKVESPHDDSSQQDGPNSPPSLLPPIASTPPQQQTSSNTDTNTAPDKSETPVTLKLPVASRYQLYSIGLTYNAGRDKKERRAQKKSQTYREINSRRHKLKAAKEASQHRNEATAATSKTSTGAAVAAAASSTAAPPPPPEEDESPFSIRKKIEQYRNWHEEQYRQKLKELKQEAERERHAEIMKVASVKNKTFKMTSTVKLSHRNSSHDALLPRIASKVDHNFDSILREEREEHEQEQEGGEKEKDGAIPKQRDKERDADAAAAAKREPSGGGGGVQNEKEVLSAKDSAAAAAAGARVASGKTWRTWRDVNDSYAYTDVKQYIKENELMDDEKEKYIEQWISQVGEYQGGDSEISRSALASKSTDKNDEREA